MLAIIRRLVACFILLIFASSFIPWGGITPWEPAWWVERVQFVPALLGALSGKAWAAVLLAALLILTLIFGRVYCSWLCPLGMLQDAAIRLAHPLPQRRKGKAVRYAPNHPWLRACFGLLGFAALVAGCAGLLTWLDPYSIAARGMAAFLTPALHWLGGLAGLQLPPPAWERYAPWLMGVAAFSLALPLAMAVWRGRLYCNSICPVGAVLGLLARVAPCTPHIDPSACGRCAACMKSCKAQAINVKTMQVDATRCVGCYNCLAQCSRGAMALRPRAPWRKAPAPRSTPSAAPAPVAETQPSYHAGRRAFLGLSFAGMAAVALPRVPEPAPSTNPAEPGSNTAPAAVPPGAQSQQRFLSRCTACGLCISNCPTQVLRPALLAYGLSGFMKPTLDFTRASCDPNCVTCSHACPEGALLPLSLADKRRTQIGLAHYAQNNCLVWAQGVPCGKCVADIQCPTGALVAQQVSVPRVHADKCRGCRRCTRVCPAGAITRVSVEGRERLLAVIDRSKCIGCGACAAACRSQAISLTTLTTPRLAHPEKCIGCGACEHICPAAPQKALSVIPRAQHLHTAE